MAIDIKFDLINNPEPPTLILANRNGNKLGQLNVNHKSVELIDRLNEASEISFTVNKYIDGKITNLWDKLLDFKLIYCEEWKKWFECKVELDEETESVKTVFCTQLGQAELSQTMLYNIEINTEIDIERDDYEVTVFKDYTNSSASLLDRLLEKAPHYTVDYIAPSLIEIQRSFSFDDISIYDALQEVAEEIGCLFVFNSDSDEKGMPKRTISVYDLQQNCKNPKCKYRGEFTDKCPKCNSEDSDGNKYDIEYGYGNDTLIFVTVDELASEGIQLVTDTDAVKNCFKLEAGDDLMTATIRNRNPNGTDYIWYFSDATKEDMPVELVQKIESYDKLYSYYYTETATIPDGLNSSDIKIKKPFTLNSSLVNSYNNLVGKYKAYYDDESKNKKLETIPTSIMGFASLMNAYYNTIDFGWYLKSGMMPDVKMGKTDAEEQGLLLSATLPPLIAVTNLDIVSKATADSSVLMMAKAVVNSKYKVEIRSSSLSGSNWSGVFTITNYSDEEDTYTTGTISRALTDWDETYIQQKIDKMLSREGNDDLSIVGLFKKEHDDFCAELKRYALVPLTSFHAACQACLDILIEQGVGKEDSEGIISSGDNGSLYEALYVPYYNKLKALEVEMATRENEVNIILGAYDVNGNLLAEGLQTNIEDLKIRIQNELNFEKYLGEDLWLQFCTYRREDKYRNENYISDGLNNGELFQRALEFYEVAENEIFKSSELQHSITATLNNLLAIPKFKSLVESFEVGNWIRVQVDDFVYKLRLVEYEINYDDFNNISVKFSDVAKTKSGYSDLEDILSDASSMSSSYDSIKRQANSGNVARDMIRQWLNEGLDASLIQIQNNTNEDIVIDNNGLIGRSYSDITEQYSPEQIRLTHNIIAYTNNDWKSVKQAIGKHKFKYYDEDDDEFVDAIGYGMSADFVTAAYISSSQIIGGDIYSDNYSVRAEVCRTCGYIGEFEKITKERTDENGNIVHDENGNPYYDTVYVCPECGGEDTRKIGSGSHIDLRYGTFSLGGGALRFEDGKLIISSNEADSNVTELNDEWLKTTSVYAENLWVNSANVSGKLTANQIDASELKVNAANVTGKLTVGQIDEFNDKVTTITSNYIETTDIYASKLQVNAANISGQLTVGQIDGLDNKVTTITSDYIKTANIYASNLQVDAANISGQLTANQINATGLTVNAANITGQLQAYQINASGLQVNAANITGQLQAYQINAVGLTVDAANITGTLTARALKGNMIDILGEDYSSYGCMYAGTNSIGTTALEILGYQGLRLLGFNGTNVYLESSPGGTWGQLTVGNGGVSVGPTLYNTSGGVIASDKNKKHDIEYDIAKYDDLFNDLKPVRYKYNDGTSNRFHLGLIANDVKDSIDNNNLDTQEFAAYCEIPVYATDENGNSTGEIIDYTCGLRYDEFVSLNIWQIQRLKERTLELEKQVTMLTEQLSKLNLND